MAITLMAAGAILVAVGAALLWSWPAALIVTGVAAVAVGWDLADQ